MKPTLAVSSPAPRDHRWLTAWLLLALVMIVGIASAIAMAYQATLPGLVKYPNLEHNIVEGPISYPQDPPVGGNYSAEWQNCGIYGVQIPNETTVHSLARGAVWISYRPDMSLRDVAATQKIIRNLSYAIMSPNPNLSTPIVVTAWGAQLAVSGPEDYRLPQFINQYHNRPDTPEYGQPCTGGVGEPKTRN